LTNHRLDGNRLTWSIETIDFPPALDKLTQVGPWISELETLSRVSIENVDGVSVPCFRDSQASLLFWKLGSLNVDALLNRCVKEKVTIIIGTSGSGKTREIFEVLTRVYGLYFTLKEHVLSGPGSLDFTKMLQRFKHHVSTDSNPTAVHDESTQVILLSGCVCTNIGT
jgi:hypothetical protein